MDKYWMKMSRASVPYRNGVEVFINFAFGRVANSDEKILCPCVRCINCLWQGKESVREHLIIRGFMRDYTFWGEHGEVMPNITDDDFNNADNMTEMLNDVSNRSKQKSLHNPGTKSIPSEKREMIEIERIRADETSSTCNSRTGPSDPLSQADLDRHGRLAAMGLGVTAKSAWGSRASTGSGSTQSAKDRQIEELQSIVQMLQADGERRDKEMEDMRATYERRAKEMEDMRAAMRALTESMKSSQSQHMQEDYDRLDDD